MRSLAIRTITVLLLLAAGADAGDSCCKKRLQRLIPDAAAVPPDVHDGQPRLIVDPDPANVRPESWDDEDDGPWEPEMVPNPAFAWRPPMVPNPEYTPPTLATELEEEARKAAPWVVLGVGLSALLEAAQLPVEALAGLLRRAGASPSLCSLPRHFPAGRRLHSGAVLGAPAGSAVPPASK